MKKFNLLLWPILTGIFVYISSILISHLFFSQLPLLETIFLPDIIVGALFLTLISFILISVLYSIKEIACYNAIPLIVIQIDRKGKIVFTNDYFKKEVGKYNIEIKNTNILDFKPYITEGERFAELITHLLRNPEAYMNFSDSFKSIHNNFFKITVVKVDKKITLIGTNETYHKNLENEISEKDSLYENLINAIPLPIGFRNTDGSLRFGNKCFTDMMENSPENDPEKQAKYKNNLEEVITNKENKSFHLRVDNKILEVNQTPVIKDKELDGVICFGIDKTKEFIHKKQTEERNKYQNSLYKIQRLFLKLNNENFEEYIHLILKEINNYMQSDVVYFYEINNNKRKHFYEYKKSYAPSYINKIKDVEPSSYKEFLERFERGEEFISNNPFELKTTTDKFFASLKVTSLLEKSLYGENFKGMLGVCNFTKTHKWNKLEISYMKIIGEILLNSIERVLVEKDLFESEETFKILTENSPLGVVIFDINNRKGNIHYINQEAIKTLGYSEEELNKMRIEEIIDKDFVPVFDQLLEDKENGSKGVLKLNRKNDSILVEISLKHIKITNDRFSKHILISMIDLDRAMHIFNSDD